MDRSELLPRFVVGDETKIRQILQNLLSNAMKFTEKGGVAMRIAVQPGTDGDGSDRLRVEVEDSGPGIAPEEMGQLFKVFEQTESGAQVQGRHRLGAGHQPQIRRTHGGDPRTGKPTGPGQYLPAGNPGCGKGPIWKTVPNGGQVSGLEPGQPSWRVLVVDDNSDNRGYLETLLTMIGFGVRTADDGAQGVGAFTDYKPHPVLMDLRMPVMEGPEAIRRIRSMEGGDRVKIIAVSASSFKEDQKKAIQVGADDFVSKPFREETLFEKIEKLLGVKFTWAEEKGPAVPGVAEAPPEDQEKERAAAFARRPSLPSCGEALLASRSGPPPSRSWTRPPGTTPGPPGSCGTWPENSTINA